MGNRFRKTPELQKPAWLKTSEELDSEEGWCTIYRFRTKTEMAVFVNNPECIAELEYRYPYDNYRRKLDINSKYIAVLRR
jgi:hypothetical protein